MSRETDGQEGVGLKNVHKTHVLKNTRVNDPLLIKLLILMKDKTDFSLAICKKFAQNNVIFKLLW